MTKAEIIAELKKDKEFADCTDEELEEIAELEIKSGNVSNYVKAQAEKKPRTPKERKVDEEKAELLEFIKRGLTLAMNSDNIIVENETKLHFEYNGSKFTVNLTRHRPKK